MFPLIDDFGECSLCGVESWKPLLTLPKSRGEVALIGCTNCGIARRHPLPTTAEMAAYYDTAEGWDGDKPDPKSPRYEQALENKRQSYEPMAERLHPRMSPAGDTNGSAPRVLDFGCGIGAFLDAFAAKGWKTIGLEPGPISRDVAASRHDMIEQLPATPTFEAVLANHVIEHLRDPVEDLRRLATATVTGGSIFVQVPSLEALSKRANLGYACGGVHLHSFSRIALRSALLAAGFERVEVLKDPSWRTLGRGALANRATAIRGGSDPWDCRAPHRARALDPAIAALKKYAARTSAGPADALHGRSGPTRSD